MSANVQLDLELEVASSPGVGKILGRLGGLLERCSHRTLSEDEKTLLEGLDGTGETTGGGAAGLTDELAAARPVETRRDLGQFFTPEPIVDVMTDWVVGQRPDRIVDAGCGTGNFAMACARKMPGVPVVAIDTDPVATLICRARCLEAEVDNVTVRHGDFLRDASDTAFAGKTAYIGNPPYVRHHRLPLELKEWAAKRCGELGVPFSKLAGLHAYFFLATAIHARPGDIGCYVTSAEWLDVKYGACIRHLLLNGLGLKSITVLDDARAAFEDAMTSAAITCFEVGRVPDRISLSKVRAFQDAEGGGMRKSVPAGNLNGRWGALLRNNGDKGRANKGSGIRLGDLFSVHRGVATGANKFFVMPESEARLRGLARFAQPVVSAGRQVSGAKGVLQADTPQQIVVLPKILEALPPAEREAAETFLEEGRKTGVTERYLCRHRRPWWWLGELKPAPIVASYMARRPPSFAWNPQGALLLNIAHGLFPKIRLSEEEIRRLVDLLNENSGTFVGKGRTYQGGLEKFEPGEMEELMVPLPSDLLHLKPPAALE